MLKKKMAKGRSTPYSSEKSAKRMCPSFTCVLHNTKVPETDNFICFGSVNCDLSKKTLKIATDS